MPPLLLHSLAFYSDLLSELARIPTNPNIVEAGSESGAVSEILARLASDRGGHLYVVEPEPSEALRRLSEVAPVKIVTGYSPEALADVPDAGLFVIDGDHNYATVHGEVTHIFSSRPADDRIAVFHDVGWPSGRRDQYYAPGRLPAEAVHPHSWTRGVVLDQSDLARPGRGFRGLGAFAFALHEGGARNGVLTAVEDALDEIGRLKLWTTPLVFGLGVVCSDTSPHLDCVERLMAPYVDNPTLAEMESNRLRLLLALIDQRDDVAAQPLRRMARTLRKKLRRGRQSPERS